MRNNFCELLSKQNEWRKSLHYKIKTHIFATTHYNPAKKPYPQSGYACSLFRFHEITIGMHCLGWFLSTDTNIKHVISSTFIFNQILPSAVCRVQKRFFSFAVGHGGKAAAFFDITDCPWRLVGAMASLPVHWRLERYRTINIH